MQISESFFWGFGGSVAVEMVRYSWYAGRGEVPRRYRSASFWVTRMVLALIAGAMVYAYGIESRMLAINIGALAPMIVYAVHLVDGAETLRMRSHSVESMQQDSLHFPALGLVWRCSCGSSLLVLVRDQNLEQDECLRSENFQARSFAEAEPRGHRRAQSRHFDGGAGFDTRCLVVF